MMRRRIKLLNSYEIDIISKKARKIVPICRVAGIKKFYKKKN